MEWNFLGQVFRPVVLEWANERGLIDYRVVGLSSLSDFD